MKKTLLFLAASCSGFIALGQQKADTNIPVDFKKLQARYTVRVTNKSTFVITISNINRNLYKIDGVKAETDYNTAIPTALTGIKLPGYIYQTMPDQSKMHASAEGTAEKTSKNMLETIKEMFGELNQKADKLDASALLYNEMLHLSKNCADDQSQIVATLAQKVKDYMDPATPTAPDDLANYLDGQIRSAVQLLPKIDNAIKAYEAAAITELAAGHDLYVTQLQTVEKDYNDPALKKAGKEQQLAAAKKQYLAFKEKVDDYPADQKTLAGAIDQLKQNYTKAQALVEDMKKFKKDDKIYTIVRLYKLLNDPGTFSYTSELMTAKTDEIKYTITIEPTELNPCGVSGKKIIDVTVKVRGGLKIDFSTGAFLNWGSADFIGQNYYYQYIDANTRQIVTADRGNRKLMSVGALMHLYRRSPAPVKVGGSVGVSVSTGLTDLNFHVGPSLFLGNQNRIVLSTGLTFKSSSLLDQNLATNTPYQKALSPDAIPTVSVFPTLGYFLALTYNFTQLTKK